MTKKTISDKLENIRDELDYKVIQLEDIETKIKELQDKVDELSLENKDLKKQLRSKK